MPNFFLIRFDFSIPENFLNIFYEWAPWFVLIQISVFYFADLYKQPPIIYATTEDLSGS